MIKDGAIDALDIIALTADATPENKERCKKIGFKKILTKPIDLEILRNTLLEYKLVKHT